MKALVNGERVGSLGVVLGLFGVICLLAASLGLNFKHAGDLQGVKRSIYLRCVQRQSYDQASTRLRQAEVVQFHAFAAQEAQNRYVDAQLRTQRVAAWTKLATAAQTAIDAQVRGGCDAYR